MILADKIMNLRKKNGWSQEELAEKLGVSRQSISKYEGAQSVPDLDKILKLSRIFGVSTDYLMKDEMETEEYLQEDSAEAENGPIRRVSMEMAREYLDLRRQAAGKIAAAVMLCILSPVVLIFLSGCSEYGPIKIRDSAAAGIGMCVLLLMVAAAVAVFIMTGMKIKKYEFLQSEPFETEYGVSGMLKEEKEAYQGPFTRGIVLGVVCCICSVVPLFFSFIIMGKEESQIVISMVCVLLIIISIGVNLIVRVGIRMAAIDCLLEESDYSREKKAEEKRMAPLFGAYWMIATAIYLIYSFVTNDWDKSWIVWPAAGVLYPVFRAIAGGLITKEK